MLFPICCVTSKLNENHSRCALQISKPLPLVTNIFWHPILPTPSPFSQQANKTNGQGKFPAWNLKLIPGLPAEAISSRVSWLPGVDINSVDIEIRLIETFEPQDCQIRGIRFSNAIDHLGNLVHQANISMKSSHYTEVPNQGTKMNCTRK